MMKERCYPAKYEILVGQDHNIADLYQFDHGTKVVTQTEFKFSDLKKSNL